MTRKHILGIDIGGTKISVCVGAADGEIHASERWATDVLDGPEKACDHIAAVARELSDAADLHDVIGVSAPGPLSSRRGAFVNPPNMPGWHGFPIAAALGERLGRRVRLMNDANAAALAEWKHGAGRGCDTMIFFTMSTGMGAGLIVSGRLHEGPDDMAGEVGRLPLTAEGPVGFGRRGSLEGWCSGPGIEQVAAMHLIEARHDERASTLLDACPDPRRVTMEALGEAARAKDEVALAVFAEVGRRLGQASSLLVDILNPELIVVGTIGRLFHDLIFPFAMEEIAARSHTSSAERVRMVPAALGADTGDVAAICAALA